MRERLFTLNFVPYHLYMYVDPTVQSRDSDKKKWMYEFEAYLLENTEVRGVRAQILRFLSYGSPVPSSYGNLRI